MYKSHPITSLLNFILIIIALAMLKNNSILFLIALVLLFLNYKNPNKYYSLFLKATFLFSFLSLLFGTISFLVKVSLLVIYIIEGFKEYNKMDMFTIYDTIFPQVNKTPILLLKLFYYKDNIIKYYHKIKNIDQNLRYKKQIEYHHYIFITLLKVVKGESENYLMSYEKRLFFNKNRNRYKIVFSKRDLLLLLIHITGVTIIYYVGRSPYAIFN